MGEWVPYAVIAFVAGALIAAVVVLARRAWRRQVRRFLVQLQARREALRAALDTLERLLRALSEADAATILAFSGPVSEERAAVAEIAARMHLEAQDLSDLALPKDLWPLADALGSAAEALVRAATPIGEGEGEAVLESLARLDLSSARTALGTVDLLLIAVSTEYELADPAVYGGGLYL